MLKLNNKNKLKMVQNILKGCSKNDLHQIKKEIIKLTNEEFLEELYKLRRDYGF